MLAAFAAPGAAQAAVPTASAQTRQDAGAGPAAGLAQGWSVVPSPNRSGVNQLTAVSCLSASACTAVGFHGHPAHALIESWNGTAWSVVPSPSASGHNELLGVSCVSASACTAVGYHETTVFKTLIESWNGTAWSIVPSPNKATTNNVLSAVSCVSASACTAAGGGPETLIESWNGATWSIVPSPNRSGVNQLTAVSCLSATACTAVGFHGRPAKTLAESWNGSTWSVVPSPNKAVSYNALNGVSCVSATACTAVGTYANRAGAETLADKTLAESWNGTAWSVLPSPSKANANNQLAGVSCVPAGACTAVGNYATGSGMSRTLIESWNGSTWSMAPSPNKAVTHNALNGVSCVPASTCTTVGFYRSPAKTLVESSNSAAGLRR